MLNFKEPQIEDRQTANSILYPLNYRLCEYCFGDLFIWRRVYNTQFAFEQNYMYVRFKNQDKTFYLFPAGIGDLEKATRLIYEQAKDDGTEFKLACVTPEMRTKLEEVFPGKFDYEPVRDSYDYIYNASDLITLAGRKLHSKRNHIARFERLGNWSYDVITHENINECEKMSIEWCKINGCGNDLSLNLEYCAVKQAFEHYFELGMSGGMITLDGRVVAFSIGQKINNDTFVVHIEKAFSDVEGAYTVINREFAAHNCENFSYINREDDAGEEGLRKAKLSYHPSILLEKNFATLKDGVSL
jgi:uncharacterized protein